MVALHHYLENIIMTNVIIKSRLRTICGRDHQIKPHWDIKPGAKRHHTVSCTLAPLYTVFGLKLDCSGAAAPIGDKVL